jgi:RNA polymerase-associated protein RTF1
VLLKLVLDLAVDLVKPYKINDQTVNQAFELKHGNSVRTFPMDKVSNSPFTQVCVELIIELTILNVQQREFGRLVNDYETDQTKLLTKRQVEKKGAQLSRLINQPMTEVCAILEAIIHALKNLPTLE